MPHDGLDTDPQKFCRYIPLKPIAIPKACPPEFSLWSVALRKPHIRHQYVFINNKSICTPQGDKIKIKHAYKIQGLLYIYDAIISGNTKTCFISPNEDQMLYFFRGMPFKYTLTTLK